MAAPTAAALFPFSCLRCFVLVVGFMLDNKFSSFTKGQSISNHLQTPNKIKRLTN